MKNRKFNERLVFSQDTRRNTSKTRIEEATRWGSQIEEEHRQGMSTMAGGKECDLLLDNDKMVKQVKNENPNKNYSAKIKK